MAIKSAHHINIIAALVVLSSAHMPAFAASESEQGIALYNARDYNAARLAFERVTRANPGDWQAQYYLGHCCYALGQMPQARYAYQMAMHHSLHPAVKAQCQAGLDNIDKYKTQIHKTGTSTSVAIASKSSKDDDEEEVLDPNSPQAKAEKAKDEIMQRARAEISKIHKAAQEQIQFESENSNTICKYPDGHKALDIPYQRVDAINAEAEEKCTKIMNDAEARCRGYH
ncbi:MAG: tetratricopeptide repeat protein [Candidatus Obscuribacter sp.]|nr:tetratricopeptide repeat protein [Candidatus Obscuribacter sp.]